MVSPDVVKNQTAEVSHTAVSAVNTAPPSTGTTHRLLLARKTSIFAVNAP